jgi:hypothetical protein
MKIDSAFVAVLGTIQDLVSRDALGAADGKDCLPQMRAALDLSDRSYGALTCGLWPAAHEYTPAAIVNTLIAGAVSTAEGGENPAGWTLPKATMLALTDRLLSLPRA